MNKTELKEGKALLIEMQRRFNKQDSILAIAVEQHQLLGRLIMQFSGMFVEMKKKENGS